MKTIPLTQDKVALVSDEDFEALSQHRWYAEKQNHTFYAARHIKIAKNKWIVIKMHTDILGKKEGYEIDHIDGDGLNNQRNNIRHVTHRQNTQNLHIAKSSKYPGVRWHKTNKKWEARIKLHGIRKILGHYTNEHEAYMAYAKAVKEYVGEDVIWK